MGSPGIVLTALRWWVEAQGLPSPIRRFRRRAIALALRSLFSLSLGGLARGLALLPSLRLALLLSLRGLLGLTLLLASAVRVDRVLGASLLWHTFP